MLHCMLRFCDTEKFCWEMFWTTDDLLLLHVLSRLNLLRLLQVMKEVKEFSVR